MSPLELFLVLLAVAFFGGLRVAHGSKSFWGFSSGIEYLVLGVILGPHLLALVTSGAVSQFEAPLLMGLAWFFSVRGLSFGWLGDQRTGGGRLVVSILVGVAGSALVYLSARFTAEAFLIPDAHTLALGLAAVSGESATRAESEAPRSDSASWWASGTQLGPLLFLGSMVLGEPLLTILPILSLQSLLLSVLLGALLAAVVAALLAARFERAEVWPLLLGSILLVAGTALRVQLAAATSAFILGLAVSLTSRHHREIRELVAPTERQLLLPCLLLAGIVLSWPEQVGPWAVVGAAVAARTLFKLAHGRFVGLQHELMRASGFTLALGLVAFLRQSDQVGQLVLATAVVNVLLGELLLSRGQAGDASSRHLDQPQGSVEAIES